MTQPMERAPATVPAGLMAHPTVWCAVLVLVLNDHVFKAAWPSWWTGKLSDAAGMVFFPLLLQGLWEVASHAVGRWSGRHRFGVTVVCCAATGVVFGLVKCNAGAAALYRVTWGALRWPLDALALLWRRHTLPALGRVQLTMDPTDLWVLPFLGVALWLGFVAAGGRLTRRRPAIPAVR